VCFSLVLSFAQAKERTFKLKQNGADDKNCLAQLTVAQKLNQGVRQGSIWIEREQTGVKEIKKFANRYLKYRTVCTI
jgi:hypothetical protein